MFLGHCPDEKYLCGGLPVGGTLGQTEAVLVAGCVNEGTQVVECVRAQLREISSTCLDIQVTDGCSEEADGIFRANAFTKLVVFVLLSLVCA